MHWIIRGGTGELALFVPAELAPRHRGAFALHVRADVNLSDRSRAIARFRRAIGLGPALRAIPFADARRQAIMLYIYDARAAGASLRDIAGALLDPIPADWRTSSVRSDLRRLADLGERLVGGGWRELLR